MHPQTSRHSQLNDLIWRTVKKSTDPGCQRTTWPDTKRWKATRRRNTNSVGTGQTSSVELHSARHFCTVSSTKHFSYSRRCSRQSSHELNSDIWEVERNTLVLPCGNRDGRTMERTSNGTNTRNRKKIDHRHIRPVANEISFPAYFHNHPERQCSGFPKHFPHWEKHIWSDDSLHLGWSQYGTVLVIE